MTALRCSHPTHPSRQGQPGWSSTLGTADHPLDGMLCAACAPYADDLRTPEERNADLIAQALDAAVARLAQIVTQQTTVAAAAKDATQAGQVGQLWTATQMQANALIDIATMLKRLRRLVRGDFTGTD